MYGMYLIPFAYVQENGDPEDGPPSLAKTTSSAPAGASRGAPGESMDVDRCEVLFSARFSQVRP